jgi:hypothetical protein
MNELKSLAEIFNNRIFRVPDFQRGYAWGESQVGQFWEDLMNLDLDRIRYHYTGVLTLEPIEEKDARRSEKWKDDLWVFERGFRPFYIIDGQQRLTTIIILTKVILDRFDEDEAINFYEKRDLRKRMLMEEVGGHRTFILGYERDGRSEDFLRKEILGLGLPAGEAKEETLYTMNLQNAKAFFEKKTSDLTKKQLEELMRKILTALRFHVYEVDNEMDVFLRFETINNRGRALSKLELLKNRLIYLTTILPDGDQGKAKLRNRINETWKTIFGYVGRNKKAPLDEEEFLQNHCMMFFSDEETRTDQFFSFLLNKHFVARNTLSPQSSSKVGYEELGAYVDSISISISRWFYMLNPFLSDYREMTKDSLNRVKRQGAESFKPLILAAMVKNVPEVKLAALLEAVYAFQLTCLRLSMRRSRDRDNRHFKMANDLLYGGAAGAIEEIISEIKAEKEQKLSTFYLVGIFDPTSPSTFPTTVL